MQRVWYGGGPTDDLNIELEEALDYAVLRLAGPLSMRSVPQARLALDRALQDTTCVLVDVTDLWLVQGVCGQVFTAALTRAGSWPWAKLALFGAAPVLGDALRGHRITSTVPLAADLGSAWVAAQQRPDCVRISRQFAPAPVELGRVRATVRDAALAWQLSDDLRELAVLVTNELVTNAIEHAGTRCDMSLELARALLGIRVRDYFPARLPRCRRPDPTAMRGRGLHLVSAFTSSWGVERQPDGKTVWARLPAPCTGGMHQPCSDPQRG
ncbi:MAG: ATP-binding protein [Actinomycetota bacterium]|nr:ATP-binding protein [Actinomycetota bacterium]